MFAAFGNVSVARAAASYTPSRNDACSAGSAAPRFSCGIASPITVTSLGVQPTRCAAISAVLAHAARPARPATTSVSAPVHQRAEASVGREYAGDRATFGYLHHHHIGSLSVVCPRPLPWPTSRQGSGSRCGNATATNKTVVAMVLFRGTDELFFGRWFGAVNRICRRAVQVEPFNMRLRQCPSDRFLSILLSDLLAE